MLSLLGFAISAIGEIKLGKADQKPEHSLWAWTAMLDSAGMALHEKDGQVTDNEKKSMDQLLVAPWGFRARNGNYCHP
ncbi:MAG: BCCT family transporter [Maribacter sp.]|nr:BCCT family transporter [Maribacter sp.]